MAIPEGAPREAIPGGWISDIGTDGSAIPRAGNGKGLVKVGGYVAYGGGLSIPVTWVGCNHGPCKEGAIGGTVGYGLYPCCWTALLECVGAVCIVSLGNIEESTEGGAIFTLAAKGAEGEIPGGPGVVGVFCKPGGTWYGTGANPIFTVLILGEGKEADIELELVWETCATGTAGDGGSIPCCTSTLSTAAENWNQSADT